MLFQNGGYAAASASIDAYGLLLFNKGMIEIIHQKT
jgi:hypothetical protein